MNRKNKEEMVDIPRRWTIIDPQITLYLYSISSSVNENSLPFDQNTTNETSTVINQKLISLDFGCLIAIFWILIIYYNKNIKSVNIEKMFKFLL